jgi:2-hydroxy-3-keto-5-methylthiopentenyl-1-phosphate phosphatase
LLTVVSDFDGTILKHDLALLALKKFGRTGWERFDELLSAGKITVEQCVAEQYAMIEVDRRQEITDYVDSYCRFRPGLAELLSECRQRGLGVIIVSAGLDFCIKHAFHKSGLATPKLACPKSSLVAGRGFRLSFPRRRCAEARDFKEDTVVHLKRRGNKVIFIGDGAGDFNAAVQADFLFAIKGSPLDLMCADRDVPHKPIKTLTPVVNFVRSMDGL